MFTLIVVANDGSEGGFRAVGMACDLANRYSAALHMISVEELPNFPVAAVVERVKALKADLLVVGFMGHSALYERIIGGTADRLVRLAPCPVLVVK